MRGGGGGGSYTFAPAPYGSAHLISNELAYAPASNCQLSSEPRFGTVPNIDTGGIPGLKGGRRLKRKRNTRRQRGGSYGMALYDGTVGGFPGSSGIAGVVNNGCSAPSQTEIPIGGASGMLNSHTGGLWQKGGAQLSGSLITEADAPLSSATTAAQSITIPTAGYTHLNGAASVGGSSTGVPYMINVPADGRASASPAGPPSSMNGGRRGSRRTSRVNRKRNRNSRRRNNGAKGSRRVNRR